MTDPVETRLARLEAESAIRQLAGRYSVAIDDRDLDEVGRLFIADARVASRDGVMEAVGRAAILKQFEGRYTVLGATNHVSHDHLIRLPTPLDGQATGIVSAHAEVWRHEQTMIAAIRYADRYAIEDGEWRFAERVLSFLYYVPLADYAHILGALDRNRAYDKPKPADYPEALPTWKDWRGRS